MVSLTFFFFSLCSLNRNRVCIALHVLETQLCFCFENKRRKKKQSVELVFKRRARKCFVLSVAAQI